MTRPLFIVAELPATDEFTLDGPEGRHAADVQRLRPGQELLLGDGRGGTAIAVVAAAGRGTLTVTLTTRSYAMSPRPALVAVQGIAKGERGELAVQAMTEVGVDVIVPWVAARSVARWRDGRGRERWSRTAHEAAKQARRPWIPEVTPAESTVEVAGRLRAARAALVLHEDAGDPLSTVDLESGDDDVVVVVGPEGGITSEELAAFVGAGARPARLGPTVLRTSTAGVAALSVLSTRLARAHW